LVEISFQISVEALHGPRQKLTGLFPRFQLAREDALHNRLRTSRQIPVTGAPLAA
jgi:hypothetical protein